MIAKNFAGVIRNDALTLKVSVITSMRFVICVEEQEIRNVKRLRSTIVPTEHFLSSVIAWEQARASFVRGLTRHLFRVRAAVDAIARARHLIETLMADRFFGVDLKEENWQFRKENPVFAVLHCVLTGHYMHNFYHGVVLWMKHFLETCSCFA